jgi:methionyl-tRNA synthetase
VWVDAFWNYITGLKNKGVYDEFWPPDLQLMAKDIIRVHSTIWLALLLALNLELPKKIFVHGYFTVEGKKMSKSLGNVVDPNKIIEKYGLDALRYYLFREAPFGEDGDFSEKSLVKRYNTELADSLGNLVNRVLVLAEKGFDGDVPKSSGTHDVEKVALNVVKAHNDSMESLQLHNALNDIFFFVGELNKYVNTTKPWEIKDKEILGGVLYNLLEGLRFIAVLLEPFTPETSEKIFEQLGLEKKFLLNDLEWGKLKPGTKTKRGKILFEKIKD